jgi:hypothetical protein
MNRARGAAYWLAPPLFCLLLDWYGFTAWFRADDFAWLGVGQDVHSLQDLLVALFSPLAQGTIRPLSERAFFMLGFGLFGLDALPFRLVIFLTQFVNLVLVTSIGNRLTGLRAAGFWAAVLWVINGALVEPLGWACVYNQVLCGFFLLLAFRFLLRYVETGKQRYNLWQWGVFLVGFGALELNLVYPALAAGYTFLCARKYFRRTLPLFAASIVYLFAHYAAAPVQKTSDYAMHFTGGMLRTLGTYWTWSVGPAFQWTPFILPAWVLPAGIAVVSLGLLAFLVRKRVPAALFCLLWFVVTIAPVLPLRDHVTEYYVFLPVIGLCWLGGWALVEAWRSGPKARAIAVTLAVVYGGMEIPAVLGTSEWNNRITMRARNLVESVAQAHQLHPGKAILLEGVDSDLFWNAFFDRPFRLIGIDQIALTPGSGEHIDRRPDLGDVETFVLPADAAAQALDRDGLVVYDVRGPRLRNVTSSYTVQRNVRLPSRVDAANAMTAYLLGPEWYQVDGDHRWMPQQATLRMGGPTAAGQKLYLRGDCSDEQLRQGPLPVTVTVEGSALPAAAIRPGESSFEISFPLPDTLVGKPSVQVTIHAGRVFSPPGDARKLGLAFGVIEVR